MASIVVDKGERASIVVDAFLSKIVRQRLRRMSMF
jgi:hypothetical protein